MKRFLPTTALSHLLILLVVLLSFFSGTGIVLAQTADDAVPKPKVPCDETRDPEFNSLRPYQASPCGDTNYALFCGNKITITVDIPGRHPGCVTEMNPNFTNDKEYWIDLSGTEFPILGNTELSQNSTNTTDSIDDATKLNEYVSWYLNGVNNRAEYGDTKSTNDEIINFSGPIQKLLPQAIAEATRIASIDSASSEVTYIPDEGDTEKKDDNESAPPTTELQTHNQIVVCAQRKWPLLPPWLTNFFGLPSIGIGNEIPVECYPNENSKAQGTVFRLSDTNTSDPNWVGSSSAQEIVNWAASNLANIYPANTVAQVVAGAATRWPLKIPPLPWADEHGKPFASTMLYQKAYNEWRGQLCAIVPNPITGKDSLVCLGAWPLINNPYADLFPYVPLASTPDKLGKMPILSINLIPGAGTVIDSSETTKLASPSLFYAHTQEAKDLSETLNKTYVPSGLSTSDIPATSTESNDLGSKPKCRVLNVRSNPGDDLFPIKTPGDIGVHVKFHVNQIDNCVCNTDPVTGRVSSTCHGMVSIEVPTNPVKVPYANEIWKSTVAGNASTFRKIYPKVEEGAPVSCIADIPSVTNAVYTNVENADGFKVEGPMGSPDEENMDPENAKIYFPHFGSVYDYFLKGIQTALRPKGYGDPTPISGTLCVNSVKCGELPELPKASGSCNLGSTSSKVGGIPQSLKDIISAAAETYKVPPNLILGVMYGEGLFDGSNKKDWTDENVKNWSTCQQVPGCSTSGDDRFMGFNGNDWENIAPHIRDDLLKLDPDRQEPSQCNLLDAIYGMAWNLHDSADGGMDFQCFGLDLSAPVPTSCTWNANQYESAIKIAENGYDRGCFTLKGSCATGGGNAALCNNGVDGCEKYFNAGNTSHNACVWDVAHGN